MGKGSNRRKEDTAKIWDNWDSIFGKKDIKEEVKEELSKPAKAEEKPGDNNAK